MTTLMTTNNEYLIELNAIIVNAAISREKTLILKKELRSLERRMNFYDPRSNEHYRLNRERIKLKHELQSHLRSTKAVRLMAGNETTESFGKIA